MHQQMKCHNWFETTDTFYQLFESSREKWYIFAGQIEPDSQYSETEPIQVH